MASNPLARLLNGNPVGGRVADALETRCQNGKRAARFGSSNRAQTTALEVSDDLARRIVSGRAGHAAARMGAGAAHVKAGNGAPIIGMAQYGPGRENLTEIEGAVENIAADKAEGPLEVERRQDLAPQHGALEVRRIGVDRGDHQIGHRVAMVVP